MFWAGLLPCLPAVGALVAGTVLRNALLRWAGVPVGVATGVVLYAWLGHLGYRRLAARGLEMLFKMRIGRSSESRIGISRPTGLPISQARLPSRWPGGRPRSSASASRWAGRHLGGQRILSVWRSRARQAPC
jgi:hypothetical protein